MPDYMQIALDAILAAKAEHAAELERVRLPPPADFARLRIEAGYRSAGALARAANLPPTTVEGYERSGARQLHGTKPNLERLAATLKQQPATVLCALRRTYDATHSKKGA